MALWKVLVISHLVAAFGGYVLCLSRRLVARAIIRLLGGRA